MTADAELKAMLVVGETLGKTLTEVGDMPVSEFALWCAHFSDKPKG